jgi:spore coat protein CotF
MAKQYKIIKASDSKLVGVIFEYAILNNMAEPKWFTEFVNKQFKPLATKIEKIEEDVASLKVDVADLKVRVTKLETKLDTVIKLNNLKTK